MTTQDKVSQPRHSRRAFLKGAATIAYVSPLVVSLPAKATRAGYGSGKTDKGPKHGKQYSKGKDNDKDNDKGKREAKYESDNTPDPLKDDRPDKSHEKYAQSPYSSKNSDNKGATNYQFEANSKSHFKK